MSQIEINSDKYTVLAACLLLVFVVWGAVVSVLDLVSGTLRHRPPNWFNYLTIVIFSFGLLSSVRNAKFRRSYTFGMLAFGLLILNFAVEMALGGEASGTVRNLLGFVEVAAYALAIFEIARWFRAKVKVTKPLRN